MLSEFTLIDRFFTPKHQDALLGIGDDCALLAPSIGHTLAVTTDLLVAGTHFYEDDAPFDLGWKTLAVNLSDLAAMGAKPRWATLALSLPKVDENWLAAFSQGFFACAEAYKISLIGGDTTQGPMSFCVTALGEVPKGRALRRDAAKAGDDLWVSGFPGRAHIGLLLRQGKIALSKEVSELCLSALAHPLPQVALGLRLQEDNLAHAAIDISDGLLSEAAHLARRSSCEVEVYLDHLPPFLEDVPNALAQKAVLSGGDDYELLWSAPPEKREALLSLSESLTLPLWRIGKVKAATQAAILVKTKPEGTLVDVAHTGFVHFS